MIFEICALISVCLFALLTFYMIQTLLSLRYIVYKIESRLKKFDSLLDSLSNIGEVCEKETEIIKHNSLNSVEKRTDLSFDLVEWLLVSLKLSKKLVTRR